MCSDSTTHAFRTRSGCRCLWRGPSRRQQQRKVEAAPIHEWYDTLSAHKILVGRYRYPAVMWRCLQTLLCVDMTLQRRRGTPLGCSSPLTRGLTAAVQSTRYSAVEPQIGASAIGWP